MLAAKDKFFKIYNYIINYIFPPSCAFCANYTIKNDGFCSNCFNKLNFITTPYCKICGKLLEVQIFENLICGSCIIKPPIYNIGRSLLKFDEHSKNMIHAFKYFDKTAIAAIFARLIVERYGMELKDIDLIVPVPMNRLKRLLRLYNHSQILSKEIAKIIDKPLIPDLLIKTKWTKSQTSLSKNAREKNLSASLQFNKKYNIKEKNVLLVDDVKTTGATIKKCSSILKKAGSSKIVVITIAAT